MSWAYLFLFKNFNLPICIAKYTINITDMLEIIAHKFHETRIKEMPIELHMKMIWILVKTCLLASAKFLFASTNCFSISSLLFLAVKIDIFFSMFFSVLIQSNSAKNTKSIAYKPSFRLNCACSSRSFCIFGGKSLHCIEKCFSSESYSLPAKERKKHKTSSEYDFSISTHKISVSFELWHF